jgi:hypothetical protein
MKYSKNLTLPVSGPVPPVPSPRSRHENDFRIVALGSDNGDCGFKVSRSEKHFGRIVRYRCMAPFPFGSDRSPEGGLSFTGWNHNTAF